MKKENSTNSLNEKIINAACGTAVTLSLLTGRWKTVIVWQLLDGKLRYTEIKKRIPGISERMLSMQLKDLERDGLISRHLYAEVPPRVEYELTPLGLSMKSMLQSIDDWGDIYRKKYMDDIADSANFSTFDKP